MYTFSKEKLSLISKCTISRVVTRGDVEWAGLSETVSFHKHAVDVTGRGHHQQTESVALVGVVIKGAVADLAGRHQEVILRTNGVLGEVVNLDEVRGDQCQLSLRALQP